MVVLRSRVDAAVYYISERIPQLHISKFFGGYHPKIGREGRRTCFQVFIYVGVWTYCVYKFLLPSRIELVLFNGIIKYYRVLFIVNFYSNNIGFVFEFESYVCQHIRTDSSFKLRKIDFIHPGN